MNEADSHQAPVPQPIEPAQVSPMTEPIAVEMHRPTLDEGWQTVDFPGAVSVDAISSSQPAEWDITETNSIGFGNTVLQGVIYYSDAEISPADSYVAIGADADRRLQIQQLQQENAALRDRLLQVEQALVQQLEGQLAAAEAVDQPLVAASAIDLQPFQPLQEHLQPLLQELERSHQIAQRQQILIETLTEQFSSGQDRIAQLERDCALTQQRYNEQVQQVLQAESACRDLRLRLHRQQQQTLQLKAALEKCLEMPPPYGHSDRPDVALASKAPTPDTLAALLPKNSPVQPWSLAEGGLINPSDLGRPTPLHHGLNQQSLNQQKHEVAEMPAPFSDRLAEAALPVAAESSALLEPDDPQFVTHLMQLIFPAVEPSSGATEALQPEPLLDPSPFLEAIFLEAIETERADANVPLTLESSSPVAVVVSDSTEVAPLEAVRQDQPVLSSHATEATTEAIATAVPLTADGSPDPLWHDLATLIDPLPQPDCTIAAAAEVYDRPHEAVVSQASLPNADLVTLEQEPLPGTLTTTGIPPIFAAAPDEALRLNDATTTATPSTWTWRDRLVTAGQIVRSTDPARSTQPAKRLALSAVASAAAQPTATASSPARTATTVAAPPSPIVYPLRSTKKLASLAAVDLPTFPKR